MRKPSPNKFWTPDELKKLVELYPDHKSKDLVQIFNRSQTSIDQAAYRLGLRKSESHREALREFYRKRNAESASIQKTQFPKGLVPWNKGKRFENLKAQRHWFKPGTLNGQALERLQPVGTYSVHSGYLYKKIGDKGLKRDQWKLVHRLMWEAAHGSVPAGHIIVFKSGTRTTQLEDIRLENLECLSRRELLTRNGIQRYPRELRSLITTLAHLRNKIQRKEAREKHHDGCAKPPCSCDGSPE